MAGSQAEIPSLSLPQDSPKPLNICALFVLRNRKKIMKQTNKGSLNIKIENVQFYV